MTIREQIIEANKAYRLGRPVMTDQAFDDLCEAYEKTVSPEEYAAFRDSLHALKNRTSPHLFFFNAEKQRRREAEFLRPAALSGSEERGR